MDMFRNIFETNPCWFFATHSQNCVFLEGYFGVNRKHWGINSLKKLHFLILNQACGEFGGEILQDLASEHFAVSTESSGTQCVSVALFIRFISQRAIVNPIFLK